MPERLGRIGSRTGKHQDARTDRVRGTARLQPSRISARLGRKLCAVKIIDPDSASFERLCYAGEGRPKDPSFVNPRSEAAWTLHNRLDVSHMRYEPPAGGRPAHTRTQPPFHFCPGVYYARLVEELGPLTYGLVGHKTKLMPRDQWSTILGHSPDVADALIQSMLLAS